MKIIEFKGKEVIETHSRLRYEIGSQTKMFTALLIFKAIDLDLLKLEDKVSEFVENKFTRFHHKTTGKVFDVSENTIKELLAHEIKAPDFINYGAAIKDEESFDLLQKVDFDLASDEGIKRCIETINASTIEEIDNQMYNNTGYWLLGKIIENVYASSLEEAMNKYIINPLEMMDTDWDNSKVNGSAHGKVFLFPTKFYGAAGGLVSSYEDMNRFMLGFDSVISNSSLEAWKDLASSRPLGAGLINLKPALKAKHEIPKNWWGHAGQTLQMQSASFMSDDKEVVLASTDDAFVNPMKKVIEEIKK